MKSKENEKKTFDVTITFKRETDYYVVKGVDLVLPTLEGTDETKEKIILKALSNLSVFEGYDFPELEVSYNNRSFSLNLDEATISKLAKKSKSLKEFSWFVHKELVKINIDSLRDYYEGRDGEPGITIKEVLECGDWNQYWGCEFNIEEDILVKAAIQHREEQLDKKVKDFLDTVENRDKARKLEIIKKVRKTIDPIELEKLVNMYLDII
jgi:hypothetical protein